jgi:hypothetical protein
MNAKEAVFVGVGKDSLGPFNVQDGRLCPSCGHAGLVITYKRKPKLSDYVRSAPALILRGRRTIGLTCGCYAKLHRQITHINGNGPKEDK